MDVTEQRRDVKLPETINKRQEYERRFGVGEMYQTFVRLPRALLELTRNRRAGLVAPEFVERVQLAVTEVNGCAACSYHHAKMALRLGMSNEEISSFLSGDGTFIKPEEAKAVMFAQHYAASRGHPKKYAYDAIVQEYGEGGANIILAAVQVMTAGNAYGIPYSAFTSRRKGRPFRDSSLVYELGTLIAGVLCLPVALVHGTLRGLAGLPSERFDASTTED